LITGFLKSCIGCIVHYSLAIIISQRYIKLKAH
jgi:hypothetical protein